MSDPEMSEPATKADLRDLATKAELAATGAALKTDITKLDQRLELFEGAVVERFIALETKVGRLETKVDELPGALARAVNAANEEMRDWMRAFEDRYRDLPPRVDRLEAKVFAPRRRRR